MSRLFASPKAEHRMNKENRVARDSYNRGKQFKKGQRDG
jgi:hypothetical protein